jgi:hypothetical protein
MRYFILILVIMMWGEANCLLCQSTGTISGTVRGAKGEVCYFNIQVEGT